MGMRKMRVAPGLDDLIRPSSVNTITPAVRLSRMVCKLAREVCTCNMLRSTAERASAKLLRHLRKRTGQATQFISAL